jgi:MFS family permease
MATDVNLKELEQKVIRSYFHDGIWDIYGAFILLGFGLTMVIGWDYLMLVFAALAVVLLLFRQRIIVPRLGRVKFSSERQAKTKRSILIAMITLTFTMLLGVVFFVLFSTNSIPRWLDIWMGDYFFATLGGMLALLVVIAAYIVGVWRYYVYAALIFIAYVIAGILRPNDIEGIPIVIAGSIILISGVVILTRFLRKYPLPPRETDSASR